MFNWFQRLLPRTSDFFGMFEAHAATLVAAANAMSEMVEGRTPPEDHIREIDRREHEADEIIRQVLRSVRQTFLTPFDRGSITSLIAAMDDTIDEMQSTARAIDLYELTSFEPQMIEECADLTAQAIPLLRNISSNGARIHSLTEKVVRLEGMADDAHAKGLKRAFQQDSERPMRFIIAREIYKHLERITDAFEDVANEIDGIVIDHS
jgi:uncharacterized protein Yka (UPF0111/DUF47 family)